MRDRAYEKAGLARPVNRIWSLQRSAHSRQSFIDNPLDSARDDLNKYDYLMRLDASHELAQNMLASFELTISSLDNVVRRASHIIEKVTNPRDKTPPRTRISYAKPVYNDRTMKLYDLEASPNIQIRRFKELEEDEHLHLQRYLSELEKKQDELNFAIDKLNEIIKHQRFAVENLENDLHSLNARFANEKRGYEEQLHELMKKYDIEKDEAYRAIKKLKEDSARVQNELMESSKKIQIEEYSAWIKEKQTKDEQICKLTLELEDLKLSSKSEINEINRNYSQKINLLNQRLDKEKEVNEDLEDQVLELQNTLKRRESELVERLEKMTCDDSIAFKDFRETLDKYETNEHILKQVINYVYDKIHPIYLKFAPVQKDWASEVQGRRSSLMSLFCHPTWQSHVEYLVEIEFLIYLLGKINNDKDWLVERLTEYGKENEKLRYRTPNGRSRQQSPTNREDIYKQVWRDIRANDQAVRSFEDARHRLLEHFRVEEGDTSRSFRR
jgi:hypothetical protein